MLSFLFWVVVLAIAAILVSKMILVERKRLNRRIEEASFIASQMGLTFNVNRRGFREIIPNALIEKIKGLSLFNTDGYQLDKCINFVFEKKDKEVNTYLFEHYSSDVTSGHKETVACFVSPKLNLPNFCLSPNNLLLKGLSLAIPNIKFEDYPNFSKNYFLYCDDEIAIRLIFTPDVLSFLENNQGLWVEGFQDTLIYCRYNALPELKDVPRFYGQAKAVANFFIR